MNFIKSLGTICLATICCLPAESLAGDYAKLDNQQIWELRLSASRYASQEASKKCAWKPESPTVPADQFIPNQHISRRKLFRKIMAMLRLDQNAMAISFAIGSDESNARVGEVDADNLSVLKDIVSAYGFPTVEEVGEVGVNAMLMLVAHADKDLRFQKFALHKMEHEVATGQLPAITLPY